MSNLDATSVVVGPPSLAGLGPVHEILAPRGVPLGPHQEVRRVLPNRDRRMIGAWCFADHYGPEDVAGGSWGGRGMWVPPHPHSGLQTVSWLLSGEIRHRDSLGNDVVVRPSQLNLMTSGPAIAHSEETAAGSVQPLHGVQLWVALPDPVRLGTPAAFSQHRDLPVVSRPGVSARVIVGAFNGAASDAQTFTPLVGVELTIDGACSLELRPDFEYGVLALDGSVHVDGGPVGTSEICFLGSGRTSVGLGGAGRALLLGGEPFAEELVMWWNFIGRSHDEIVALREEWNADGGGRFGEVHGFDGDRLPAPPMPTIRLKSRGRTR